ncbi:Zn-dependent exopeptidase [Lojkania enalia]|uniref:Peptide hydrolase n=1 Tax=Lojkania enalia TaxID=147567 RepID=A0A9P4MVU5_9PLEO|nr:Zn-dependent exopeptidase [Didymosphaeria enalia]
MKISVIALALSAQLAFALTIPKPNVEIETPTRTARTLFTIEFAPGETRDVTETEKWELMKAGTHFMDITNYGDLHEASQNIAIKAAIAFPTKLAAQPSVTPLLAKLDKSNIESNLETYAAFHNRYYRSSYGKQAADWLFSKVQEVITASGSSLASARQFSHSWSQSSVIATIPGQSNSTIVIGAHLDSINGANPSSGRAPGADDDGSGTMTILEAMRVLLTDPWTLSGQAPNTIEFHWYSAEEGGLLGSQAIFTDYKNKGRVVKAMLQQDMTGYVKSGTKESVGVITDYVDTGLTEFIKIVIDEYCDIPYVETKCGYACSDHASASKAGYPSSFVIEASMENISGSIHTDRDTISTVNFDHMIQHAKMTTGFGYELAWTTEL